MSNYPIFVYGTLMTGERAYSLLAPHSVGYRDACLPNAKLYASPDGYPYGAEHRADESVTNAVILGEVHWLLPTGYDTLLARLDQYEGDEYTRQLRKVVVRRQADTVTLPNTSQRQPAVDEWLDAWVYLSDVAYAGQFPQIPNGDWRRW